MAEILKGVWEDDKGNQYYSANDTETTYDQAGTPLNNGGDLSEASVNFSVGTARKALTPKARFKALMGDIAKWLTDLGTAAFCNVANNDTTTVSGFVAGAQIVKTHGDEIDKLNEDLGGLNFKEEAGKKYVRGADAVWVPLGNNNLVLMDGTGSYAFGGINNGYYSNFQLDNFDYTNYSKIKITNLGTYPFEVVCGTTSYTSPGTFDISALKQATLRIFYRGAVANPPILLKVELIP